MDQAPERNVAIASEDSGQEAIPAQLWLLRSIERGVWIRSGDDEVSLVCQTSREDADAAARYTDEHWGIPCVPVQVI